MMVHPAPFDVLQPMMIAAATFDVAYTGKEAHAAFYPELGINAADGFLIAQTALNALRQHIRDTDRIHGIVTSAGSAANIVPAHAAGRFMARSRHIEDLEALRGRVVACFEAGALATGSTLALRGGDRPYADVRHDPALAATFEANMRELGRDYAGRADAVGRPSGSTDMGNVSQVIPSIHPFIGIDSYPAVNHQPEFTAACITEAADQAIVDAAVAMAWTAIDVAARAAA
jgi:metal-dependent amidase/aminoacylase/carboxypeptidase family protein